MSNFGMFAIFPREILLVLLEFLDKNTFIEMASMNHAFRSILADKLIKYFRKFELSNGTTDYIVKHSYQFKNSRFNQNSEAVIIAEKIANGLYHFMFPKNTYNIYVMIFNIDQTLYVQWHDTNVYDENDSKILKLDPTNKSSLMIIKLLKIMEISYTTIASQRYTGDLDKIVDHLEKILDS